MTIYRSTWAEVNLQALDHNIQEICRHLKPECKLMAMVKANAYGHGIIPVAKRSLQAGASWLAVATLDEAIQLAQDGITAPILVLGYVEPAFTTVAVENNFRVTIFTRMQARALGAAAISQGKVARIHIKVDTGMGRLGVLADDTGLQEAVAIAGTPGIEVEGIYTHLPVADSADKSISWEQAAAFQQFTASLEDQANIRIPIKHLGNSAIILDMPELQFDMVRAGIILYGLYPSDEVNREEIKLQPVMRFLTHVAYVKEVPAGYGIGYGHTFITNRPTRVATLPVGYADGYPRCLSNRGVVGINGQVAPVIGRVCMDQIMVDVTDLDQVEVGDEVVIFGREADGVTAETLANLAGTISYELVTMVSSRVPRLHIG
ncbi:MAG: alanine racemase [Methylocystaceae bacterium]